jgi:predicted esterase
VNTSWPPPAPFTDANFLYNHFRPATTDPQQGDWYFRMFVPPSYDPQGTEKYPVVIFLHGLGEVQGAGANQKQMANNGQYAFCQTAKQAIFPCFFILPATNGPDFIERSQTIPALLNALAAEYRIDLDRVVLTGLSYGGGHTIRLASAIPEVFCAAVPLSSNADATMTDGMLRLPMWYFTAKNDTATPPVTALSNARTRIGRGGKTIITLFNTGGHSANTWPAAWGGPALIPWLARQRRGIPVRSSPAEVTVIQPTRNPAHQRPGSAATYSGTCVDTFTGGISAGITKLEYSNGNYPFAGVGFAGTTTVLGTTPQTIENWTAGSLGLGFSSGASFLTAVAVGTSWSTSLGGETYHLTGLTTAFVSGSLLAPENLNTTLLAPGDVEAKWEYSGTSNTNFKLERRTGSTGAFVEIATLPASARSYSDLDLPGDQRYYYRIRAISAATQSLFTKESQILVINDADADGMPNSWESQFGLDPENAADAELDSDNDGISNLLEYALDSPPQFSSVTRRPGMSLDSQSNTFALSYFPEREELQYKVEATNNLADWSSTTVNQGTIFSGEMTKATVPFDTAQPSFLRLRVTSP